MNYLKIVLIKENNLRSIKKKANMKNNIFEHLSDNQSSDHLSKNSSTVDMGVSVNPGDITTGNLYNKRY